MNKKNKILNLFFIIISCIIIFFIAKSRYVDRMPTVDIDHNNIVGYQNIGEISVPIYEETVVNYTFIDNAYELFLGQGFPTILIAFITVILSFILNKIFIKQDLKIKQYIILFFIMLIINILVYRVGISIVV